MSEFDGNFCDESFCGTTRLFPLPGAVLFPHAVQAFHIFEPRYRRMLQDAIDGDRLISMAVLTADEPPGIDSVVCLGQVINQTLLADGRSNILLMGLRRARILEELPTQEGFRRASVEIMEDIPVDAQDSDGLAQQLLQAFSRCMPKSAQAADQLKAFLGKDVCLGVLTDLIAHTIPATDPSKVPLLRECSVSRRAALLLPTLKRLALVQTDADPDFPPKFSIN